LGSSYYGGRISLDVAFFLLCVVEAFVKCGAKIFSNYKTCSFEDKKNLKNLLGNFGRRRIDMERINQSDGVDKQIAEGRFACFLVVGGG
jgi:hypothetical protein